MEAITNEQPGLTAANGSVEAATEALAVIAARVKALRAERDGLVSKAQVAATGEIAGADPSAELARVVAGQAPGSGRPSPAAAANRIAAIDVDLGLLRVAEAKAAGALGRARRDAAALRMKRPDVVTAAAAVAAAAVAFAEQLEAARDLLQRLSTESGLSLGDDPAAHLLQQAHLRASSGPAIAQWRSELEQALGCELATRA